MTLPARDRLREPPPTAPRTTSPGLLPAHVAVGDRSVETERTQPGHDLLGHRDAAVLPTGAADRDRHEPLALAQVAVADGLDHRQVALEELLGVGPGPDVG